MTDWFDPQTWMRQLPDPLNMRGLLQDSVATWLNEWARLGRNRPVEIRHGDQRVTATIRSITLYPHDPPPVIPAGGGLDALERAVIVVDDVEWEGRALGHVEVAAADVRFQGLPAPEVRAGPVTVEAVLPMATLAAWVATAGIDIVGGGDEPDELVVDYRWWRLEFRAVVVPAVTARTVLFTIRELRLRDRVLPLPKRFDLSLSVDVELPTGTRLRDAKLIDAETIAVEAQVLRVAYPVAADQLLEQLATGSRRSVIDLAGGPRRRGRR